MPSQRILLIAYYWPPAGGVAVQRWLQMSRYLAEMGWQITVVTSANPNYPHLDPNLENDIHPSIKIIKVKGFEPRNILSRLSTIFSKKKNINLDNALNHQTEKSGLLHQLTLWIRSNHFIPDARIGWAKAVIAQLPSMIQELPNVIISTGPPQSTHLAAMKIAHRYNIPWVADFRDPWMENESFERLKLTPRSVQRHQSLESKVVKGANLVTTVSPSWAALFRSKGASHVEVVYNGYNSDDFGKKNKSISSLNDTFTVSHLGTLGDDRLVPALFKACMKVLDTHELHNFRLLFIGDTSPRVTELGQLHQLSNNLEIKGYLNHEQAINEMFEASLLLLIQNKATKNIQGRIPAKVFEYMATGKPILMIGDTHSDLAKLLSDYPLSYIADFEDEDKMYEAILHAYQGKPDVEASKLAPKFTRQASAQQIHTLLMSLLSEDASGDNTSQRETSQ